MSFCFYPKHEYACPHVMHCPHLGGAALGNLVIAADEQEDFRRMLLGQVDHERELVSKLFDENEALKAEVAQLKLELKVERQRKFATSADSKPDSPPPTGAEDDRPKKRGAPVGHPGWFRPTPTQYDRLIEVDAPGRCPHCGGCVHLFPNREPDDHLQEDVVDGTLVTDCYSGYAAHQAKAKQKCLAHLARTARDWQKVVPPQSLADTFFMAVREWVRRRPASSADEQSGGTNASTAGRASQNHVRPPQ